MSRRIIDINIQQGYKKTIVLALSQYDVGVVLQFNVYDGARAASFAEGTTVTLQGRRPSGVGFMLAGTIASNIATFTSTTDITGEAGAFPAELRFVSGDTDIGTVNLMVQIERAPHPDGTIDADITRQQTFIERLEAVEDDKVPFPETNKYGTAGQVLSTLGDGTTEWTNGASWQGVSEDLKVALLQIAQKVAYIDGNGQDYYDDLYDALYPPAPPATLVSISAVYTQSGTVYDTDALDSLKSDLVVTAHYDNGTSEVVTTYTLSGTLAVGTSTITVSHNGKTTTFNVTVSEYVDPRILLYNWDLTSSLTDTVGGKTATLTYATQDSGGVHLTAAANHADFSNILVAGSDRTIEVDVSAYDRKGTEHGRFIMIAGTMGFIYRKTGVWALYLGNTWTDSSVSAADAFDGKTVEIKFEWSGTSSFTMTVSCDGTEIVSGTHSTASHIMLGSNNSNAAYDSTFTALRVYEGVE